MRDDLKIIKLLKDTWETLTPPKKSLEELLQTIDNQDVTKKEFMRYNYSNNMNWKFVVPILLVVIALFGFFAYKNHSGSLINNSIVTAQNADNTLKQTDVAINQSMDQLDKDLKDVGAVNQEEDPNSL